MTGGTTLLFSWGWCCDVGFRDGGWVENVGVEGTVQESVPFLTSPPSPSPSSPGPNMEEEGERATWIAGVGFDEIPVQESVSVCGLCEQLRSIPEWKSGFLCERHVGPRYAKWGISLVP